jgi:tRNA pseudouridine55 synthase
LEIALSSGKSSIEPVNGIILLNKEDGLSSNRALQNVKKLIGAKKGGHGGSLDPAATGMLILCFGEATKICPYLLNNHKTYRVIAEFGKSTSTGDREGTIEETSEIHMHDHDYWVGILEKFLGESAQIPPMYSALKKDGQRLYKLARKGEVIQREARKINISSIKLENIGDDCVEFLVTVSKGTYIRVLVEDIAKKAGMVGYTKKLHRVGVGNFKEKQMLCIQSIEESIASSGTENKDYLLPVDTALLDWSSIHLNQDELGMFLNGRIIEISSSSKGLIRVYDNEEKFIGIGEQKENYLLIPRRIFNL